VEVTLTATITPDGITNLGTDYDERGYTAVNAPFSRWIIETHPEALVASANGCTYESDCSTTTTTAG
jgi:hypothetical protein